MAGALMHAPRILVVDEPTVGMDPRGARLLKRIFRDLAAGGATVFMSTHSLEVAEELCDRIGIIQRGRLIALGSVDELRTQAGQRAPVDAGSGLPASHRRRARARQRRRPVRLTMANGSASQPLDLGAALDQPQPAPAHPVRMLGRLLAPRRLAARNRWRRLSRAGRWRLGGFLLLALAFGAAIFVFFYRALSYFLSVPEFGPVLTYKLLGMVFVTFFSILLFSNIVDRALDLLPVARARPPGRGARVGAPALLRAPRRDGHRLLVDVAALRPARVPRLRRGARHRAGILPRHRPRPAAVRPHPRRARRDDHDAAGQRLSGAAHQGHPRAALGRRGGDALPAVPPRAAGAAGESGRLRRLRRLPRRHADAGRILPAQHLGDRDPLSAARAPRGQPGSSTSACWSRPPPSR